MLDDPVWILDWITVASGLLFESDETIFVVGVEHACRKRRDLVPNQPSPRIDASAVRAMATRYSPMATEAAKSTGRNSFGGLDVATPTLFQDLRKRHRSFRPTHSRGNCGGVRQSSGRAVNRMTA